MINATSNTTANTSTHSNVSSVPIIAACLHDWLAYTQVVRCAVTIKQRQFAIRPLFDTAGGRLKIESTCAQHSMSSSGWQVGKGAGSVQAIVSVRKKPPTGRRPKQHNKQDAAAIAQDKKRRLSSGVPSAAVRHAPSVDNADRAEDLSPAQCEQRLCAELEALAARTGLHYVLYLQPTGRAATLAASSSLQTLRDVDNNAAVRALRCEMATAQVATLTAATLIAAPAPPCDRALEQELYAALLVPYESR